MRDFGLDFLKALAICAVVAIHAGVGYGVLRFCVPVFICIWAYYFESGALKKGGYQWRSIRGKCVRLAVPYVFWTLLYLVVFRTGGDWKTTSLITKIHSWWGGYGWSGQYFIIILFQLMVVVPFLSRLITKRTAVRMIAIGVGLNWVLNCVFFEYPIVHKVGYRLFIYWLPYVVLGISVARGYLVLTRGWMLASCLLFLAPVEYHYLSDWGSHLSMYLMATVMLGSMGLFMSLTPCSTERIESFRLPSRARRWVSYLGRNTLPVFLAHNMFIHVFKGACVWLGVDFYSYSVKWVIVWVCVCLSLTLAHVFKRCKLGILIGV